jgi:subtilisin family serine protease
MYPAAYPEVLAVSAGNRQGEFAPYANRGPFVDLVLPGSGIVPYGGDSWLVTGTSTATAYASGAAAGLWKPEMGAPANLVPTMLKNFGLISAPSAKRP